MHVLSVCGEHFFLTARSALEWHQETNLEKKKKNLRWKWCNVDSGCGSAKGLIFHITTVLGAKLTRLFLWRQSQGCFWLPGKQTTVTEESVFSPGSVRLSAFQNKVGDSFSLGWIVRGGGDEGQVPRCGLRLSWVMKEPPLENLTCYGQMKTAQTCHWFSQTAAVQRGKTLSHT